MRQHGEKKNAMPPCSVNNSDPYAKGRGKESIAEQRHLKSAGCSFGEEGGKKKEESRRL